MARPGLSLVGFLERAAAIDHLATACILAHGVDDAGLAIWRGARAALGPPIERAGRGWIGPAPPALVDHLQPIAGPLTAALAAGSRLAMVEIDPLICPHVTLDLTAVHARWARLSAPPTLGELLELCLPTQTPKRRARMSEQAGSILAWSDGDELGIGGVAFEPGIARASVRLRARPPFVEVARAAGRLRLVCGLAPVVAARLAGATAVPCVLREGGASDDCVETGIADSRLASVDPPTVGHFALGRAWPVRLRAVRRMIHVSWSEHLVPDP